jgi:hypothetical protein
MDVSEEFRSASSDRSEMTSLTEPEKAGTGVGK